MDLARIIPTVSLIIQLTAVVLALKLIPVTGGRRAWLMISLAIFLMAVRRLIPLCGLDSETSSFPPESVFELLGLATSLLLTLGIANIGPYFLTIRRSEEAMRKARDELEQRVEDRTADLVSANERLKQEIESRHWESAVDASLSESYKSLISPSSTIEVISTVILEQAKALTGSEKGWVLSIDPPSGRTVAYPTAGELHGWSETSEETETDHLPSITQGETYYLWGWSVRTREGFYANTPGVEAVREATGKESFSPARILTAPVMLDKELVGLFVLTDKGQDYTGCDLDAVRRLAEFYALAVQRKRVEMELTRTARRLEQTFASLNSAVFILKASTRTINACNPAVMRLFGYSEEELKGKSTEILHADSDSYFAFGREMQKALDEKGMYHTEFKMRHKDGEQFFTSHTVTGILDDSGKRIGLVSVVRDITERKQSEEALKRISRQNEMVLNAAGEGIFGVDQQGRLTFVNPAAARMLGWEVSELLGKPMHPSCHHNGANGPPYLRDACQICKVFETGETTHVNDEMFWNKEGVSFPVEYVCTPIVDKGEVSGAVVVFRDIADRKRMEEERETTIELLRLINSVNNMRELVDLLTVFLKNWSGCDAVGIRLRRGDDYPYFGTRGFSQKFVMAESHLCSVDSQGGILRDGRGNAILECICGKVLRGKFDPSKPYFTKGGSFWTNESSMQSPEAYAQDLPATYRGRCHLDEYSSMALIPLRSGEETYGLVQFNDKRTGLFTPELISFLERLSSNITIALAQRGAEEERRRLSSAVEQTAEAIIITDVNGMIQYVNPAFSRITGFSRDETIGRNAKIFKKDMEGELLFREATEKLGRGEVWTGRIRNIKKNVTPLEVETTISPVCDVSGRTINYVAVGRDITHEAQMERQLLQSQKMEAIGTLAGGIAHDFNNILGAILASVEMARDDIPKESRAQLNLDRVLKASYRARDLVKQILAFSRKSDQRRAPVEVGSIVKEALKLLRASLPTTIEIRQDIVAARADGSGLVLADPIQIHQVLMNLCTNAAHAMRETGGVLSVRLQEESLDQEASARLQGLPPGDYLRLTVSDTGHGIDCTNSGIIERIFDPFFTTKGPGEGTGMGLSVVHGIVRSHGGAITVESETGKGASFHVFLPQSDSGRKGSSAKGADSAAIAPRATGKERILFVDDEEDLVNMWEHILTRLGYDVTATSSSMAALELFRAEPDSFDLVVTDHTMPNMTGVDFATKILGYNPNMAVILCTGFSDLVTEDQIKALGIRKLVLKPIGKGELARLVRQVLDEARAGGGEQSGRSSAQNS